MHVPQSAQSRLGGGPSYRRFREWAADHGSARQRARVQATGGGSLPAEEAVFSRLVLEAEKAADEDEQTGRGGWT